MNEQDLILIERYISHELSPEEAKLFEQRLQAEADLRKEVDAYHLALYGIRQEKKKELKQKFIAREAQHKHQPGQARIIPSWVKVAVSAAAVIALFFVIRDTLTSYPASITEERRAQLFAEHFNAYQDESMNPGSRSEDKDTSALFMFQQAYWSKQYVEALTRYDSLSSNLAGNDRLLFFKANLLMATEKYEQAIPILEQLAQNPSFVYAEEVSWFLALSYIRTGEVAKGVSLLELLRKSSDHDIRENARQLLKELKK
jgi:hypothetical protein